MDRKSLADGVLSVSALTEAIKQKLELEFPPLRVQGEISNFRRQSSGHCYFSLKDAQSQISAVLFRGSAARLPRLPADGDSVTVAGQINVYAPRGQVQLVVRSMLFSGVGELLVRLEALKSELKARGWLESALKKPLPRFPQKIGVVTSPTGAALQDMLHVLKRRQGAFSLLLNPVRVQGREAAGEIAEAITTLNAHSLVDVMIVGRGGGSIEDLWPFNEECVARAIHHSEIPVISAVGHETDWTLSDLVADVRAPTPSAAAEIVMAERTRQTEFLQTARVRLSHTLRHLISRTQAQLSRFQTHPMFASPYHVLGRALQQCDTLRMQLEYRVSGLIQKRRLQLSAVKQRLEAASPRPYIRQKQEQLQALRDHLAAVNPKHLLSRGYAILFAEKQDRVVSSARQLTSGQTVTAMLSDGRADLTVTAVESP